jgi:hypothetical protein
MPVAPLIPATSRRVCICPASLPGVAHCEGWNDLCVPEISSTSCDQAVFVLADRARILGDQHPDTLNNSYRLAEVTAAQGT